MHLLALACAVPWLFTWTGLIVCLVGVHLFGQSITIGYHRLLAHRSFSTPVWFERLLIILALCCLEDTPARWVATHRAHHAHSDEEEDPHSPLVTFLWGHMGWLFVRNHSLHHLSSYERYARDILRDPFCMWLERRPWHPLWIYLAHAALFFGMALAIAAPLLGTAEGLRVACSILFWGVFLRTVLVWHITWSVNSLTHLFGYRNHATEENSRNNWLVALVAAGEGWHNNHHADPKCCSVRHRWWELDVSHLEIRALGLVGLAWDIVPPRAERRRVALGGDGAGGARTQVEGSL